MSLKQQKIDKLNAQIDDLQRVIDKLNIEVEQKDLAIAQLQKAFDALAKAGVKIVHDNQTTKISQTYQLSPGSRTTVDYMKMVIARELSKALTNYITFDVEDDASGEKVITGTAIVVNKGVFVE